MIFSNQINTKIVGILNLTPDSFSGDGRLYSKEDLIGKINSLIENGADIIDIGAESTAPGSDDVSEGEEMERLELFFEVLKNGKMEKLKDGKIIEIENKLRITNYGLPIFSLDTRRSSVAFEGTKRGVSIINDTSGGRFDEKMFDVIASTGVQYVMMYCANESGKAINNSSLRGVGACRRRRSNPEAEQSKILIKENIKNIVDLGSNDNFKNLRFNLQNGTNNNRDAINRVSTLQPNITILDKIFSFFESQLKLAYKAGIKKSQIILDPGMGAFISTNFEDSIKVLQGIQKLKKYFGLPILVGTSRKGFLGKIVKDNGPGDRLGSSIASSFYAALNGADYIRVHDVKEMKQFIEVWNGLS